MSFWTRVGCDDSAVINIGTAFLLNSAAGVMLWVMAWVPVAVYKGSGAEPSLDNLDGCTTLGGKVLGILVLRWISQVVAIIAGIVGVMRITNTSPQERRAGLSHCLRCCVISICLMTIGVMALTVSFVYTDDGCFAGGSLNDIGFVPGVGFVLSILVVVLASAALVVEFLADVAAGTKSESGQHHHHHGEDADAAAARERHQTVPGGSSNGQPHLHLHHPNFVIIYGQELSNMSSRGGVAAYATAVGGAEQRPAPRMVLPPMGYVVRGGGSGRSGRGGGDSDGNSVTSGSSGSINAFQDDEESRTD